MTEKQKEFESKEMVIPVNEVPDLTDTEKFDRRGNVALPAVQKDSPNAVIMMAMQGGYSPELIEKMMDLSERNNGIEAKRAYVKAIADFKRNAPVVHKDKENKQFKSYYASKGAIVNTIAPAMADYGLTHRWEIEQSEGLVKLTCILTHELGHSESSTMSAPPDTSGGGSKNPIQQIKSTRTYLQVATFEDVTGTASSDDSDDDGNSAVGVQGITENQIMTIETMVTDLIESKLLKDGKDFDTRLDRLFKVKKIDELTEEQGNLLIKKLGAIV